MGSRGGVPDVFHTFGIEIEGDDGFAGRLLHVCMCFRILARSLIHLKYLNSFFLVAYGPQALGPGTERLRSEGSHKGKYGYFALQQTLLQHNTDGDSRTDVPIGTWPSETSNTSR